MMPTELEGYLRDKLGSKVTDAKVAYGQLTVTIQPDTLLDTARLCKEDPALRFDFFDFMAGVDEREAGFAVITHLYSVTHQHHINLRVLAPGGREAPMLPSLTDVYRGADWHEREAYDMFGIEFASHPGLLPRILNVENFEGFPLRKDFLLATREAKPWPGAKEPEERKEHTEEQPTPGTTGDMPTATVGGSGGTPPTSMGGSGGTPPTSIGGSGGTPPTFQDKATAAKARAERAKAKAAAMRKKKARETAQTPPSDEPMGAAGLAGTDIAKDAAAGAVQGDMAAGAPGDLPGTDEPVDDPAAEAAAAEGALPMPSGTPGIEAEGRREGAVEQSATHPTPGMDADPPGRAARRSHETPAPDEPEQSEDEPS